MEISVVGTAAPIIAKDIGGLDSYAWIFTIYLLTATLSMPIWGRSADQIGRKKLYLFAMGIFLLGSILCGFSQNMTQLIFSRGIKGLGGGGLFPLAFTIIADIYPYRERIKVQGYLSSVWGISSIIGPFIGGGLTELIGWRSIFFVNLIPGSIALYFIIKFFHENKLKEKKIKISFRSFLFSTLFTCSILLGLKFLQINQSFNGMILISIGLVFLFLFLKAEKKSQHPLIPKSLLKHGVFTMSCATGFFTSMMIIGLASFGPLLFQAVLGMRPTESGLMLVPFTLAWMFTSILSPRLLLKAHYRNLLLLGHTLTLFGFTLVLMFYFQITVIQMALFTILMGMGMAFDYPIAMIMTQQSVPAQQVGLATSGIAWIRNIGTTIGTTFMGVTLSLVFQNKLLAKLPSQNWELVQMVKNNPQVFFEENALKTLPANINVSEILYDALFWVFFIKGIALFISWSLTWLYPKNVTIRTEARIQT